MPFLNFQVLGDQGPALVILHGLYGYGRNLYSLARQLAQTHRVYLPDLRNHGKSFHSPVWSYGAMAEDISRLAQHLGLQDFALLGHSMGGKVAMEYALAQLQPALSQLVVVDIALRSYDMSYHQQLLNTLAELDLSQLRSRQEADKLLAEKIPEAPVRQFLLSNLKADQGVWSWQFNLPVLQSQLTQITGNLALTRAPFEGPALFVGGADSDYLLPADLPQIQALFPQAHCQWLPQAGHWVHIDQPTALLSILQEFLWETNEK